MMSISQNSVSSPKTFDAQKFVAILRQHAFPGLWLWGLAFALSIIDAILIGLIPKLNFSFGPIMGALVPLAFAPVLVWRLSTVTEAESPKYVRMMRCGLMVLFLIPGMASLAVLNHILMSFPYPYADTLLTGWDRALGFDWLAYGRAIAYFPFVNVAMDQIYQAMLPALIIVGLHAIVVGRSDVAKEFLGLVMVTAVICVVIATFFPSLGAMAHLADESYKAMFSKNTGDSFVPQLIEIRGNGPITLNALQLAGLAAFPSFHCVCGVLMIYGSRSTKVSQLIAGLFGVLLIAATPTFGGHYFVDLLSGAAIALAAILISRKLKKI
ncbi:MAG: phosphatase PAP2 family protein [Alphaproteobacteria bacterium]|nr:phosphatase PAP2 family protein [Alphaproteobacteria bacterium]